MRSAPFLVALLLISAWGSHAALRARYSVPRYHRYRSGRDTVEGSRHADHELQGERYFREFIAEGVWDGWSSASAFDSVRGSAKAGPFVDAEFWVDSVFEEPSSGSYLANIGQLADTNQRLTPDGYIVYLTGGIRFPSGGSWTIISGGDDGGTIVSVDLNDNGVFDSAETVGKQLVRSQGIVSMKLPFTDERAWMRVRLLSLDSVRAGRYYRFFARYRNHSASSFSGVFWQKAGNHVGRIVPSWAFGSRRNYGAPVPEIASISSGRTRFDRAVWPFVTAGNDAAVTFTVRAPDIPSSVARPVYIWTFGDGTSLETGVHTVTHAYKAGCFAPLVRARWGARMSAYSSTCVAVYVPATGSVARKVSE